MDRDIESLQKTVVENIGRAASLKLSNRFVADLCQYEL